MPDISMCSNALCSLSKDCYRFKASPNLFGQVYADFRPEKDLETGEETCDYFIPVYSADRIKAREIFDNENN